MVALMWGRLSSLPFAGWPRMSRVCVVMRKTCGAIIGYRFT